VFRGIRATVRYTEHTAPLSEEFDTTETGVLTIQQSSPGKVQVKIAFSGSDANTLVLRGQTVEQYYPKLDEIHEYDIRKYRDLAQRLLLLGLGMSGRELAAHYEIGSSRRETIDGQPSIHLELVPKSPEVLRDLKKVELWIADKTDCAVQQKLHFPGGSYKITKFSDIEINPNLPRSAFDLPKHAKRVRMN
jgi:outer membrane lipoprotein-sorting protein